MSQLQDSKIRHSMQEIRKLIISAIMATDMSFHFSLTTEFKNHAGWPLAQCSPMCSFNHSHTQLFRAYMSLFCHSLMCPACNGACALSVQNAMFSIETGSLKFPVLCANPKCPAACTLVSPTGVGAVRHAMQ